MKSLFAFLAFLFTATHSTAQIAPPDQLRPQEGEQGWVQVPTDSKHFSLATGLSITPNGTMWASGSVVIKSTDLGLTWQNAPTPYVGKIGFSSDSNGILFYGTDVFITADGGESWEQTNPTEMNFVTDMTFVGPDTIYAVNLSNISMSTNRGRTWYNRQVDASSLRSISFSGKRGFAVGSKESGSGTGVFFRTFDGGELWQKIEAPAYDFKMVHALNKDTLIIVGSNKIARSTNIGNAWKDTTLTPEGTGFISGTFINSTKGYAVGYEGLIFHTSDKGVSWHQQSTPTRLGLYKVAFYNEDLGIATGDSGIILRTVNGGKAWVRVNPPLLTISATSSPEPFRDRLTLSYSLLQPERVSIRIYSPEGRLVTEPLRETMQSAGENSVQIDGSGWPSGPYFYELQAGRYSATGRITLVK